MSKLALPLLATLLLAAPARAQLITAVEDGFDDRKLVIAAQRDSDVAESGRIMEELKARLRELKKPGFEKLFGEPVPFPDKTYALPVCEPRMIGLPGLRHADEAKNKDHWAFYAVGEESGVQVYFGLDGETPGLILFRFRPNHAFSKLTEDNLGNRVSWDLDRFDRLLYFCRTRGLHFRHRHSA